MNSVGVKVFRDFDTGIRSTAETLMNGRYDDVVAALKAGDPYSRQPVEGLSTWVSGSPTARPDYAAKVLGTKIAEANRRRASKAPKAPAVARPAQPRKDSRAEDWNWTMKFVFDDDPEFADLLARTPYDPEPRSDVGPTNAKGQVVEHSKAREYSMKFNGKTLNPGTSWSGSHVTDGLDWNRGKRTAKDIMAAPGTAVVAPEAGIVVRHGGAQGGQAMYFLSDSGRLYWLGHIDSMAPVGARVKRGGRLALISADHAAPHLHIDRYEGDGRSWLK